MTKYLIFNTKEEGENRNKEIAISLGCNQNQNDITKYWFAMLEKGNEIALVITDETLLSEDEKSRLKDEEYMIENGWINNENL